MEERLRVVRLACAVFGFAAAVAGVVLEDSRIVWVAIALLAAAFLLRILVRRLAESAADHSDDDDETGAPR